MSSYDLEEKEQIEELKTWWQMHGNKVINVLLAVAIVTSAWMAYRWYINKQSAEASQTYYTLLRHVSNKDLSKTKALASELTEKFPGTSYAKYGAMLSARLSYENGDAKTAKSLLTWVVNASNNEVRDFARLNLVAILVDEKAYDEAIKQLHETHESSADARFLNTEGDIALLRGKRDEAKKHFLAATALLDKELNSGAKSDATKATNAPNATGVANTSSAESSKTTTDQPAEPAADKSQNSLLRILLQQKLDTLGDA